MVAVGAGLITWIYAISLTSKNATERDFIEYWAAEQQLARGANPYDVGAILRLEQAAGMDGSSPKVSFSPPVALFFALPLGYVDATTGLIAWLLLLLACVGATVWALWFLYRRPQSRFHLLAFAFPPTLSCLMAGQLGIFFFLAGVLFFWLHLTRPWLAGAALAVCALKPHLFLPCVVVLLLWSARRRDFRVVGGFVAALLLGSGLTLCLDRQVWTEYAQMMQSTRVLDVYMPTLSMSLRFLIDRSAKWLEFVPEAAGCAWAVWFYWSRRDRWMWTREGMLLLLVSALCTPYLWFSDEAMLFPAILAGIYASEKSPRAWILLGVITAASLIGVFWAIPLPSPFYLWTVPAWFAWYLYATRADQSVRTATATL